MLSNIKSDSMFIIENSKPEEDSDQSDQKNQEICATNKNFTIIHESAKRYDFQGLRALLSGNTSVNTRDAENKTPLHVVLFDGFLGHLYEHEMVSCVQVLIEFGADVNAEDAHKNTPLSLAVQNAFAECTNLLLEQKAHCSAKIALLMAGSMPDILLRMFDDGITVEKDHDGKAVVKLDWRPILQFPEDSETKKRFKNVKKETEFLYNMLAVKKEVRTRLLDHPLVEAFVYFKSAKMANRFRLFYVISVVYPIFYMIFIYFLYFERCAYKIPPLPESNSSDSSSSTTAPLKPRTQCDITIPISVASYLLALVIAAWGIGELYLQLRVDRRYLTSWRVWVIRVTIVVMGITLWPGLQINDLYNITFQYPIASMGTFLAWVMFMIQIGLYKKFSLYLEILVKILLSVVKITLMFLPLFIGFFMGFNLMFSNMQGVFSYIMMTIDVGAVAYDTLIYDAKESELWFQMLAYTFCVAFIIVIVIVFMNFLLALSIQDVDALIGQAKMAETSREIQNLLNVDLVDPSSVLVSKQNRKEGIWFYKYSPSDRNCKLPEEIRMKITLLLKSKKLQQLSNNEVENQMVQIGTEKDTGKLVNVLLRQIQDLEKKLDAVSTRIMDL